MELNSRFGDDGDESRPGPLSALQSIAVVDFSRQLTKQPGKRLLLQVHQAQRRRLNTCQFFHLLASHWPQTTI